MPSWCWLLAELMWLQWRCTSLSWCTTGTRAALASKKLSLLYHAFETGKNLSCA